MTVAYYKQNNNDHCVRPGRQSTYSGTYKITHKIADIFALRTAASKELHDFKKLWKYLTTVNDI